MSEAGAGAAGTAKREVPAMPVGVAIAVKVFLIGFLIIVLTVPLWLVFDVISERQGRYWEAVDEIGSAWGRPQHLAGPVLVVPYVRTVTDAAGKSEIQRHEAYYLPDRLAATARLRPEVRYRGLFEAVVYGVELTAEGAFAMPDLSGLGVEGAQVNWADARVLIGIADPRSIGAGAALDWGGRRLPLEPESGARVAEVMAASLKAGVSGLAAVPAGEALPFKLALSLNGSRHIRFAPFARETNVALSADWPAPSFAGAFLPQQRTITDTAFSASWSVSFFGRGYGQHWTSAQAGRGLDSAISASLFGVDLLQPVTPYRQVERAAKYGILFLVLTFLVYFLFEVVSGMRIHAIQYGMVGLSLCLFYLLLLSISEHLGFAASYAISTAAVVAQTTLYTGATTRRAGPTLVFGGLLLGLYGFLYVVLQMETYSLLSGAVALFAVLSAVMCVTRNVDWSGARARPNGAAAAKPAQG